jgi:ribonuclease R
VAKQRDKVFPARDAIVAFIRRSPGKVGTREIAREFGLKNADRIELKKILRELADEGVIAKQGKALHEPAALPPTVMADITGRDSDGELIATPTEWDEEQSGAPPKIRIHVPRRPQPGTAAGVGDRALLRIEKLDEATAAPIAGASSRSSITPRPASSESSAPCPAAAAAGAGRQEAGRPRVEYRREPIPVAPRTAISSASIWCARAVWACLRQGQGAARLAGTEKAISLIAIHAHEIPQAFSPAALREAEEAKPATLRAARTGANCRWSPSIRPTPRIMTTRSRRTRS